MALEILRRHGTTNDLFSSAESIMGVRAPAFCDCVFPRSTEMLGFKGNIHEYITCKCGEDEGRPLEWLWDKDSADPECYISGPNITFHPTYSQGTAIVRGEKSLDPGMIHFWEMKIITSLSGTETMIGIGTGKVDLLAHRFRFTSALGLDNQSWGYSFRGKAQHNNRTKFYGTPYSQGCLIGVYLDMTRGFLEFYLNRRSLGIAYTNIPIDPSTKIYPMACSTAANSSIRLLNSTSCQDTLQFRCMRAVAKNPDLLSDFNRMPGLKYLIEQHWFLLPYQENKNNYRDILPLEDLAILRTSMVKKLKKPEPVEDITDLYADAHIIKHSSSTHDIDSDEEFDEAYLEPSDYFYFFCDH